MISISFRLVSQRCSRIALVGMLAPSADKSEIWPDRAKCVALIAALVRLGFANGSLCTLGDKQMIVAFG